MTLTAGSAPDLRGLLDRIGQQVEAAPELARQDAARPNEVSRLGRDLAAAVQVRACASGGQPVALAPSPLARRLLAELRRAFVAGASQASGPVDGAALLLFLQAFEDVDRQLAPAWEQQFAERLSGPDGLELVVEVAHDLRSPLTSILFLAETIQRGRSGPVTPLQQRQLGLIYSAAFGLASVASDVIELACGGDRLVNQEPLAFAVADILESVRDIVQPISEEKRLEIRTSSSVPGTRIGQPVALSRILLNLTTNALKFTDQGYVELTAVSQGDHAVEFSVRDTGRGIPDPAISMLFEPFRRRQKDRDYEFSGSGLGLSICRKLVEAMNGELAVETGPGGTRFFFVLDLPSGESSLGGDRLAHL